MNPRNREERENVCVIRMRWVLGSPKGYEIEMGLYGTGKKTGIQDDMGEGGRRQGYVGMERDIRRGR